MFTHTMLTVLFFQIVTYSIIGNAELVFDTHLTENGLEDVKEGDFAFIVALLEIFKDDNNSDDIFGICTGSLISQRWVLTAAHCLEKRVEEELYVWFNNFTVSPLVTRQFSKILKAFMHPVYNSRSFSLDYDISLLYVRQVNVRSYGMLSAMDYSVMAGLPVSSVSGSRINTPQNHTMKLLWSGDSKVTECHEDIKNSLENALCIIPQLSDSRQRICFGDSGGPALYDGKIIGVCAFVFVSNETVGVFTPVSPFKQWIDEVTQTNITEPQTNITEPQTNITEHEISTQNVASIKVTESSESH